MIVSGCINEALYLLLLTHKNLSSLNLLVHCHREREAKPDYCTWTGKHLPPTQVVPSPSYPDIHVQWKHPTVFLQTANGSQLCTFVVHSSISKRKKKIAGVKKKNAWSVEDTGGQGKMYLLHGKNTSVIKLQTSEIFPGAPCCNDPWIVEKAT